MSKIWGEYFKATQTLKPHRLLVKALVYVKNHGRALDLGAGAGRDTHFLKSLGFQVDAVDKEAAANEYLPEGVTITNAAFEDFAFPEDAYDLVNAQYSLPFNPPESFDVVFDHIKSSLKKGGVVNGQFFGVEDSWSSNKSMTFHTKEDIEKLFSGLNILLLEEDRKEGATQLGQPKFWHVFNFIAEKI